MSRIFFLDNLRWAMIVLVISMHAADTYSPLGNWYFTDRRPLTVGQLLFFAAWQMYLQAFFMGLLFFVAGFFVPGSLERKGCQRFVRDRAVRLGVPVLFYMFVLGPVTEYFVAHSWTSTEPTSFAREWWKHIQNGQVLQENGPLWFCLALLIFCLVYAGLRRSWNWPLPAKRGSVSALQMGGFAVLLAVSTFLVRLVWPSGKSFLNMQLGDFPQYILLFAAGIVAARGGWLWKLDARVARRFAVVVLPLGFVGWLALVARGRGWRWQGAGLDLWQGFTCVAICLWLLTLFRDNFETQGG